MSTKNPFDPAALSDNVKEQAQQIWLAGLGAFAKAQEDGTKAFEKLVSDGITMQRKVHQTAEEKLAEATQKVTQAAHTLNERATGQWGKLEGIFEERVAKALHSLGVPSVNELQSLHARVAALEAQLGKKSASQTAAKKVSKTKPKSAAATPVKKTSKSSTVAKKSTTQSKK